MKKQLFLILIGIASTNCQPVHLVITNNSITALRLLPQKIDILPDTTHELTINTGCEYYLTLNTGFSTIFYPRTTTHARIIWNGKTISNTHESRR